MHNPQGGKGS